MPAVLVANGRRLWTRDLVKAFGAGEPPWGFTTSPLVAGEVVVVAAGGPGGHAIVALNRATGALAWKAGEDTVSYQSPMLATVGGREVILAAGDKFLFAIRRSTSCMARR